MTPPPWMIRSPRKVGLWLRGQDHALLEKLVPLWRCAKVLVVVARCILVLGVDMIIYLTSGVLCVPYAPTYQYWRGRPVEA